MGWGPTKKGREVGVGTKPSGYGGSLSSFRPDASSSSPDPQRNERRKSWPREWRQREKGEKQGKEACIRIGERKKEASFGFQPKLCPVVSAAAGVSRWEWKTPSIRNFSVTAVGCSSPFFRLPLCSSPLFSHQFIWRSKRCSRCI